jgi:hypothetical protein
VGWEGKAMSRRGDNIDDANEAGLDGRKGGRHQGFPWWAIALIACAACGLALLAVVVVIMTTPKAERPEATPGVEEVEALSRRLLGSPRPPADEKVYVRGRVLGTAQLNDGTARLWLAPSGYKPPNGGPGWGRPRDVWRRAQPAADTPAQIVCDFDEDVAKVMALTQGAEVAISGLVPPEKDSGPFLYRCRLAAQRGP